MEGKSTDIWKQGGWDLSRIRYKPEDFKINLMTEALSDYLKEKEKMSKKRPFQYMVLLHQFEKDEANLKGGPVYKDSVVIIDLKTVMARSEKELVFKITREIPEEHAGEPDNVEIIIRPF